MKKIGEKKNKPPTSRLFPQGTNKAPPKKRLCDAIQLLQHGEAEVICLPGR